MCQEEAVGTSPEEPSLEEVVHTQFLPQTSLMCPTALKLRQTRVGEVMEHDLTASVQALRPHPS